jgi:hypothetical protein
MGFVVINFHTNQQKFQYFKHCQRARKEHKDRVKGTGPFEIKKKKTDNPNQSELSKAKQSKSNRVIKKNE